MSSPFLCLWVRFPLGLSKLSLASHQDGRTFEVVYALRTSLRSRKTLVGVRRVVPVGRLPGEIGGRIQRALKRCRYAMHLAETLTLDKAISAQGTLAVTDDEGSSGALIGFFNESSEGWRTPNSVAFRVDGNGGNYWLFFEYGTRNGKTGGMGVFEGERYQTTKTRPFDADGTMHTWQLHYDPMAGDHGMLNFQVDGKDYSIELTKEARNDGAQFNRFGLWNQQTTGKWLGAVD